MIAGLQVKKAIKVIAAILTLFLTLFLSYYNFGNDGYGNAYYTAAIKSMTLSWHNFFFVSFDPGGFVSVDKPPVALWIQVIFVKIFGLHTWSIMLPEALAAVASVAIVYYLVEKSFGFVAGITAASMLACTPIFIAASRSNDPDAILAFILILSAWAVLVAAERGSILNLILAAILIGIGFNTKMLAAFLIVPAFGATYLLSNTQKLPIKLIHLALATVMLLVVSFSWVTAVDLTPAAQRPYVGSSSTNSEFNLVFGYNGLNRVFGNPPNNTATSTASDISKRSIGLQDIGINNRQNVTANSTSERSFGFQDQDANSGQSGTASTDVPPGPFRLFDPFLVGQISWFIPLALLGAICALFYIKTLETAERRRKYTALMLWGGWAIVMLIFFSVCHSLTHRYYLNIVAPGVAALAGIGFSSLIKLVTRRQLKALLLPVALLLSAVLQIMILSKYPSWKTVLSPALWVCIAGALVLMLILFINKILHFGFIKPIAIILSVGCLALLMLAPFVWSFTTVIGHDSGGDAHAGPELLGRDGFPSDPPAMKTILNDLKFKGSDPKIPSYYQALSEYLVRHEGDAKYLMAVPDAALAEDMIIETDKPVMAIGGFSGSNPILTLDGFKNLVASGEIKYLLNGPGIKLGKNSTIIKWAVFNSKKIPLSVYDKNAEYDTENYSLYLLR